MDDDYGPLKGRGDAMRRKVLGDAYVDGSARAAVQFGADFQKVVTAFAWGGVWSRPGLSLRDRSLVTIAVLAALHRPEELRMHLHAGLRNGLAKAEMEEAMIQVGVYAGFPAAVSANRVGQALFRDLEGASDPPANGG
jgi:alkylhydroperoxidase/carboxymuconolactone decarboxylase family protein YurZ